MKIRNAVFKIYFITETIIIIHVLTKSKTIRFFDELIFMELVILVSETNGLLFDSHYDV